MIWENFKMAISSIRAAKLRSFLTMLGMIIGIASVVSINAIGEGVKQAVKGQVAEFGTNLLQINPGQSMGDENAEDGGGFNIASTFGSSTLTERDLKTVQDMPEVESAMPYSFISGVVSNGDKTSKGGYIIATTAEWPKTIKTEMERGQFFKAAQNNKVVLGYNIAKNLFDTDDVVGKKVTIRKKELEIVGVTKKPNGDSVIGSQGGLNQAVFISFELGKEFSGGAPQINEIDAKVRQADKVKEVKNKIIQALKENHGGVKDFTVLTAEEQLKVFDTILALLTTFISAIASIALLVGGIGIMNIMLVSVTERTREIGIRKALGATRRMILTQFLIESATISLFGGILGCLGAVGMSLAIGKVAKITPGFTPQMFVLATGISVAIGIIFGIMPAFKAARKKPIDALRYE